MPPPCGKGDKASCDPSVVCLCVFPSVPFAHSVPFARWRYAASNAFDRGQRSRLCSRPNTISRGVFLRHVIPCSERLKRFYFTPMMDAKCYDEYLSVCRFAYLKISWAMFTKFLRKLRMVLLRWRCDTLCTSGFADGVMFSRNGRMARHVYS